MDGCSIGAAQLWHSFHRKPITGLHLMRDSRLTGDRATRHGDQLREIAGCNRGCCPPPKVSFLSVAKHGDVVPPPMRPIEPA